MLQMDFPWATRRYNVTYVSWLASSGQSIYVIVLTVLKSWECALGG